MPSSTISLSMGRMLSGRSCSVSRDLDACGPDEFGWGVRVPAQAPSALGRPGQQHSGPVGMGGVVAALSRAARPAISPRRPHDRHPQCAVVLRIPGRSLAPQDGDKTTHRSSRAGPDHEGHFKEAPMSATAPTQLSYDVFVSDGPAGRR